MVLKGRYLNAILMLLIIALSSIYLISMPHTYSQLPLPPGVARKDVAIIDVIHGRTPTPDNFNVWVIGIPQGHIHQFCVDTLWYANLSDPAGTLVNILAAGVPEYKDNYMTLIIKLKQGVYWSDGVEFTADDVVFTINTIAANPNLNWNAVVRTWVSSVRALDKYTVEIKLVKPNPYAHYMFVVQAWNAMYIMPKHYFEKVGAENIHTDKFNPPICIAPYVLHSFDLGGMWFLWKRRDDYLRSSLGDLVQKYGWYGGPQWVLMRAFLTESAKVLAILAGELDTMFDPSPEAFDTILKAMGERIQPWFTEWPYFWGFESNKQRHILQPPSVSI
uniref:Solute-binding protein family 5 domain-containing protein n=1 Tax=Ignisphaera aggregans TaxID=334771 RepID=A0A7C5UZ31_9CREN